MNITRAENNKNIIGIATAINENIAATKLTVDNTTYKFLIVIRDSPANLYGNHSFTKPFSIPQFERLQSNTVVGNTKTLSEFPFHWNSSELEAE